MGEKSPARPLIMKIDICLLEAGWVTVAIDEGVFLGFIDRRLDIDRNRQTHYATREEARSIGLDFLAKMN